MIQPNNEPFTPGEVRAIIEEFRSEFRVFGERLDTVCQDVAVLKEDVHILKADMTTVKDVLRIAIPELYARVKALEDARKN